MDDLTKEQKYVLVSLYHEFLNRQPALPSNEAKIFQSLSFIRETLFPEYEHDTLLSICSSLKSARYINYANYDNTLFNIQLTDKTIVYMENRFKNNISHILDFLSNFLP